MEDIRAEDVERHQLYEKKYLKIVLKALNKNEKIKPELAKRILSDRDICADVFGHQNNLWLNIFPLLWFIGMIVLFIFMGILGVDGKRITACVIGFLIYIFIGMPGFRTIADKKVTELRKKLKAASLMGGSQSTIDKIDHLNTAVYQNGLAKIEAMIATDNDLIYNTAILESAKLVDKALQELGAEGDSFGERLKSFSDRFSDFGKVWATLRLRNQIAHETDFAATKREATDAIAVFKKALQDLGALA